MNTDNCLSTCPSFKDFSDVHTYALGIVILLLMPLTVITNTVVLIALIKSKSIGLASQFFAVALCINDLLIGAITQPIVAVSLISKALKSSCAVRWVIQLLSYSQTMLEILIISSMAVERYIVLRHSLSRCLHRWLSLKRYVLAFDITTSILFSAVSVLVARYTNHFYLFSIVCQVIALMLAVVMTVSYIRAYQHVRRSVLSVIERQQGSIHVSSENLRHDIALGRSITIIFGIAFVMYLPLLVAEVLWTLNLYDPNLSIDVKLAEAFLAWSFTLIYINASVNVFVYSYYNRPVRKYISEEMLPFFRACIGKAEHPSPSPTSIELKDRRPAV